MKRSQFYILYSFFLCILLLVFSFLWYWEFPHDTADDFGAPHIIFNFVYIIAWIVGWLLMFDDMPDKSNKDQGGKIFGSFYNMENREKSKFSLKRVIFWFVGILILLYVVSLTRSMYESCTSIYNQSQRFRNDYLQVVQEKAGFYDAMWKTYFQKERIVRMDEKMFTEITKTIMENRADGPNVTWKMVSENQQIPYEQFTQFYSDLSAYVTSQRAAYYDIEKKCQEIARQNNTMLDMFPNNVYNKVLKCPHINFEYAFLSDSTNRVFNSKVENLK